MRAVSRILICALIAGACGNKGGESQRAAAAMQLVCDAAHRSGAENANPAERQRVISDWLAKEVTNAEIRALVASLGELAPGEAKHAIEAAATKHAVSPCILIQEVAPRLDVPAIATGGVLDLEPKTSMILATPNGVVVEGTAIVALKDGAFDPAELEGGAMGVQVPRLTNYLEALHKAGGTRIAIAIAPTLSFGVLLRVMSSAKQATFDPVQLVVNQRGVPKQVPVRLASRAEPSALSSAPEAPPPLQLVVSVGAGTLSLWSVSQLEGTLAAPKLTLPIGDKVDLAPLVRALEEIILRRYGSATRSAEDREILAMFEGTTPMQTVGAVLAAVRATHDGKELFPEIVLSAGFE